MLMIKKLHSGYGQIPVLKGVDLNVAEGELIGILGHNGMGKTTLLKTIIGINRVNKGTITFEDQDITRLPPHARSLCGIGYVPQGREIFPALTAYENLTMAAAAHGRSANSVIEEILHDIPKLKPYLSREGRALSGGEQQLLAIARCLCTKPRLILLDEPTEGIQPSIVEELIELLKKLHETHKIAIMLVEQNLDFISALSSRTLVMQRGELVRKLDREQLKDPKLISEYLGVSALPQNKESSKRRIWHAG